MTTLREKLVKIGAKVVRHGHYITFQLAELAVPRELKEAKVLIERWRQHYNQIRPHSALGYKPPAPTTTRPGRPDPASTHLGLRPNQAFPATPGLT